MKFVVTHFIIGYTFNLHRASCVMNYSTEVKMTSKLHFENYIMRH